MKEFDKSYDEAVKIHKAGKEPVKPEITITNTNIRILEYESVNKLDQKYFDSIPLESKVFSYSLIECDI